MKAFAGQALTFLLVAAGVGMAFWLIFGRPDGGAHAKVAPTLDATLICTCHPAPPPPPMAYPLPQEQPGVMP